MQIFHRIDYGAPRQVIVNVDSECEPYQESLSKHNGADSFYENVSFFVVEPFHPSLTFHPQSSS